MLRYLQGSKTYGLIFTNENQNLVVNGYCDLDYAGDLIKRKSASGYVFMLAGGTVLWLSQRQSVVALSNKESEYISAYSFSLSSMVTKIAARHCISGLTNKIKC